MNGKPDESTMEEDEWFEYPWSMDDLRNQYNDKAILEMRREHAFFRYWKPFLSGTDHVLNDDEIDELMKHCNRIAAGSLIGGMATDFRLPYEKLDMILACLPKDSWGAKQVRGLKMLKDNTIGIKEKVAGLIALGAYWAIIDLIKDIPAPQKIGVIDIIDKDNTIDRKVKKRFLELLA